MYLTDRIRHLRDEAGGLAHALGETGAAIGAATATTVMGFAAFIIADSGGLRGIGVLAVCGIGIAAVTAILVLPSVAAIAARRRPLIDSASFDMSDRTSAFAAGPPARGAGSVRAWARRPASGGPKPGRGGVRRGDRLARPGRSRWCRRGCSRRRRAEKMPEDMFSATRALARLDRLIGDDAPHPVGSAAAARLARARCWPSSPRSASPAEMQEGFACGPRSAGCGRGVERGRGAARGARRGRRCWSRRTTTR